MGSVSKAKVFTWAQLRRANRIAELRGYNRQLADKFFVAHDRSTTFPIRFALPHAFAGGKPVDEHYRCWIDYPGGNVFIDCDRSLYEELCCVPANA